MPDNNNENKPVKTSTFAAALFKTSLFYPIDTTAKRLQKNKTPFNSIPSLRYALFQNETHYLSSLYRGYFPVALTYKTIQLYSLGKLLPFQMQMRSDYPNHKVMADVTCGAIISAIQTPFLQALSNLKTEQQAGELPKNFRDNMKVVWQRIMSPNYIFKNSAISYLRNTAFLSTTAIASFPVLNFLVNRNIGADDKKSPSEAQKVMASVAGSLAGLIAQGPFDVVKVRRQLLPIHIHISSYQLTKNMWATEGYRSFYKGVFANSIHEVCGLTLFFILQSVFSQWQCDKKHEEAKSYKNY